MREFYAWKNFNILTAREYADIMYQLINCCAKSNILQRRKLMKKILIF